MRQKNASPRETTFKKPLHQALACVLSLACILLLSACTLGDAPTSNTAPIPAIPTGQAAEIVPVGTENILVPSTSDATSQNGIKIEEFYYHPGNTIPAGECSTLSWKVTGIPEGSGIEIYLDGELVSSSGDRQECNLCVGRTRYMWVMARDRAIVKSSFTELYMEEGTSCLEQPIDPSIAPQPSLPKAEPTPDAFGPFVFSSEAWWNDCKIMGSAFIHDPSDVAQAKFGYNLNNQGWQWIWMSLIETWSNDLERWQSDAGVPVMDTIGTPIGHIEWQIWAMDKLGNETYSKMKSGDYNSCSW